MELEAEIDRLYRLPLDEFVSERSALAKRLRSEGEREAAERVKGMRKPTAAAWALNQAVRRRRSETSALLAAGERLRAAHESLISGGGRDQLRQAMDEERSLSGTLADCAEAIASETGQSGPALKERVRATLHAAALDPAVRAELEAGRLVREHEAVGLAAFGGGAVAPEKAATKGRRDDAAAKEREERLAEAERALAEAREAVDSAEAVLDDARAAERAARDRLRERKRELAQRERELKRLRR